MIGIGRVWVQGRGTGTIPLRFYLEFPALNRVVRIPVCHLSGEGTIVLMLRSSVACSAQVVIE